MVPTVSYDPDTALLTVSGCEAAIRDLYGDPREGGVGVSYDAVYQARLLAQQNIPDGCQCPQLPVPVPLANPQSGRMFQGQARMLLLGGSAADAAAGTFRFFHKPGCPLRPDNPDYPPDAP